MMQNGLLPEGQGLRLLRVNGLRQPLAIMTLGPVIGDAFGCMKREQIARSKHAGIEA